MREKESLREKVQERGSKALRKRIHLAFKILIMSGYASPRSERPVDEAHSIPKEAQKFIPLPKDLDCELQTATAAPRRKGKKGGIRGLMPAD